MKIAFFDYAVWDYDVGAVFDRPMGGSQSAACYLAMTLARRGHEIHYFNCTSKPGFVHGVNCISLNGLHLETLRRLNLDALILMLGSQPALRLRTILDLPTKLILWTQHADDQPALKTLTQDAYRDSIDALALVSNWQAKRFEQTFRIDPRKISIMRNAISAPFHNMFPPGTPIAPAKEEPPILAYISTPFRGLGILLNVVHELRARIPGLRVRVYSSMKVYAMPTQEDQGRFGALYQQARATEGVEYMGSVPQAALAGALRGATMLAYPNTFPETSCISVMEAMAAGCQVVTSDLAALPETAAGFAALIPMNLETYLGDFTRNVVERLAARKLPEDEAKLRAQVDFVNREYTWERRAQEWEQWLSQLIGK